MPETTRGAQRRRSEERILAAARTLFSQRGYGATSVRAIAAAAGTDPALVTRWFGSKRDLYARTSDLSSDPAPDPGGSMLTELLDGLELKLRQEPAALIAALRSTLTHPDAGSAITQTMRAQQGRAAEALDTTNADVRAGLIGAVTVGVVMARYVLELDGVRDTDPDTLMKLLAPCIEHLTGHGSNTR